MNDASELWHFIEGQAYNQAAIRLAQIHLSNALIRCTKPFGRARDGCSIKELAFCMHSELHRYVVIGNAPTAWNCVALRTTHWVAAIQHLGKRTTFQEIGRLLSNDELSATHADMVRADNNILIEGHGSCLVACDGKVYMLKSLTPEDKAELQSIISA